MGKTRPATEETSVWCQIPMKSMATFCVELTKLGFEWKLTDLAHDIRHGIIPSPVSSKQSAMRQTRNVQWSAAFCLTTTIIVANVVSSLPAKNTLLFFAKAMGRYSGPCERSRVRRAKSSAATLTWMNHMVRCKPPIANRSVMHIKRR
jgi:hypothetical protein